MDLFVYSTASEENQKRLEDSLKVFAPRGKIEVFRSFDDFSQRLKLPVPSESIVVLAPGSPHELQEILSRIDLLHGLRLIVIAPDHEVETTAIAHQLRPRYLTYFNGDFEHLAAVLHKMVACRLSSGAPSSSCSAGHSSRPE